MSKEREYMEEKWIIKFNVWYKAVYDHYLKSVKENPYLVPRIPDELTLDKIFDDGQKESFDYVLRRFGKLEEIKSEIYNAVKNDLENKKNTDIPEIKSTTEKRLQKILATAIIATEASKDREKEITNIFRVKAKSELVNKSKIDGRIQAVFTTERIKEESVKQTTRAVDKVARETTVSAVETDEAVKKIKEILKASYREETAEQEIIGSLQDGDYSLTDRILTGYAIIKKMWNTMKDSKVRLSHTSLEGAALLIGDLFSVGGYPMAFPADSRYGAPIGEIANCRCYLTYI